MTIKLLQWPGGNVIMIFSVALLCQIYSLFGFAFFSGIRFRDIFKSESYNSLSKAKIIGAVCTGAALSLTLLGILFSIMSWPGGTFNIIVGCVLLFVISAIAMIKYRKFKSAYYSRILNRTVSAFAIAVAVAQLNIQPRSPMVDEIENEIKVSRKLHDSIPNRI